MPRVSVKDVNQQSMTKCFAEFLKKSGKVKLPEWIEYAKSGPYRELAPYNEDWFYTRMAAIARHIYMRSPVGVGAVRKIFGGRQRRGTRPSHFCRGSGSVARKALQALESLKFVTKGPNGGRVLTPLGQKHLDTIAGQIKMKKIG